MQALNEKRWNEIYDDVYKLIYPVCEKQGKTEEECKEIMEQIKEILLTDEKELQI